GLRGRAWLTALGVVMDAAAIALATFDTGPSGPAARLWRRAPRLIHPFSQLPAVGSAAGGGVPGNEEARFRDAYQRLDRLGHPMWPYEQAWDQYRRRRATFYPELVAATEQLLVPMEFRHHTARFDLSGPEGRRAPGGPRRPVIGSVPASQRQGTSGPWRWTPPTQRSMPLRATWSASPASTRPPAAVGRSRGPGPTGPAAWSSSRTESRDPPRL